MRICVLSDEEMQDFDVSPYLTGYEYEFVTVKSPVMDFLKKLKEPNFGWYWAAQLIVLKHQPGHSYCS